MESSVNPQKENGFVSIANEIMDALAKTPIGYSNAQVMYAVIRKTYGWHKKEDFISISQIQKMTGLSKRMTIYALQNLESKKIIIIERKKNETGLNDINKISFNKHYDQWVVQENAKQYDKALENRKLNYKKRVVQEKEGSARKCKMVVQESVNDGQFLAPTKESTTKETITKEIKKENYIKELFPNMKFVNMTKAEYEKIVEWRDKETADEAIFDIECYCGSNGKRYKSFYYATLGWIRRNEKRENERNKINATGNRI